MLVAAMFASNTWHMMCTQFRLLTFTHHFKYLVHWLAQRRNSSKGKPQLEGRKRDSSSSSFWGRGAGRGMNQMNNIMTMPGRWGRGAAAMQHMGGRGDAVPQDFLLCKKINQYISQPSTQRANIQDEFVCSRSVTTIHVKCNNQMNKVDDLYCTSKQRKLLIPHGFNNVN